MDLSVIVATYNRPELLAMVCAMLRRQEKAAVQIIVVDDGSAPPSCSAADADAYLWRRDEGFCKFRTGTGRCAIPRRDGVGDTKKSAAAGGAD